MPFAMGVFFRITTYFYTNNYNLAIKLAGKMLCIYLEIVFSYLVSYVIAYSLSKCVVKSVEQMRNSDCAPSKTPDPNVSPAVRSRDRSQSEIKRDRKLPGVTFWMAPPSGQKLTGQKARVSNPARDFA